ncbi:MAG: RNA methyltransferase [Defluviitaleaceae bacterium]|nr:RNA methyltransferase [Defluviitaleaceae bacterium]
MDNVITSSANQIVKKIRALKEKKGRELYGAFLVEGDKFIGEIPQSWEVELLVAAEGRGLSHALGDCPRVTVSESIFATLTDVKSPQGVLTVVSKRVFTLDDIKTPTIFVLEGISDPGNLGTILRTCHGLGVGGIIMTPDCVDIYSPKVVRASAGSVFHIPFITMEMNDAVNKLKAKNVPIYATVKEGAVPVFELDLTASAAFLWGNEHKGLKPETITLAGKTATIPASAESLNVSMAAAIVAYEISRQRIMQ